MKKLYSFILSSIIVAASCSAVSASAAYDNNGNYHANNDYNIKSYSTAHDYFSANYGWGENQEYFGLYKGGYKVANHICIFNPELIGSEYASSWVGANGYYSYYADSTLNSNGSGVMSNTVYINGTIKSVHCAMYCDNDKNVTYTGDIYW